MIRELKAALDKINIQNLIKDSIVDVSAELVKLNQLALQSGEDSFGKPLKKYSPYTQKLKATDPNYKAPNWQANLYDTGSFYEGMKLKIDSYKVNFYSTDSKSADLRAKYGEQIFGIQPELAPDAIEVVTKRFVKNFKDAL